MDLQELISRGRLVFARAPGRLGVFQLVNGRHSAKTIARKTKRELTSVLHDLEKLRDVELVRPKLGKAGKPVKFAGSTVYEKSALARQIPLRLFRTKGPARSFLGKATIKIAATRQRTRKLPFPSDTEILDVCRRGEDQIFEFKGPGAEARAITREIAAFLNTKSGGFVLYGVEEGGAIVGSDLQRQRLDQAVHNSVRNTIKPTASIEVRSVVVMGTEIIVIRVPPRDRSKVYYYEGRAYIRKGTNVFVANPDELQRLHAGYYVV